jgi:hypothetical protein
MIDNRNLLLRVLKLESRIEAQEGWGLLSVFWLCPYQWRGEGADQVPFCFY